MEGEGGREGGREGGDDIGLFGLVNYEVKCRLESGLSGHNEITWKLTDPIVCLGFPG